MTPELFIAVCLIFLAFYYLGEAYYSNRRKRKTIFRTSEFDDRMNAGRARLNINRSTLWHLWHGGARWFPSARDVSGSLVISREVLILDVSRWQGQIDFVKMRAAGVQGVIIKCGQGTFKDSKFDDNWKAAKEAGLPRGAYWFFDSRVSARIQAGWFWEWTKADRPELMWAMDYEENYGGSYAGWKNFKQLIDEFQYLSSVADDDIAIYTGRFYWIANSPTNAADLEFFGRYPLWMAQYITNPAYVVIPKPWTELDFILWQYGTLGVDGKTPNGLRYGVQSLEVDENNFDGSREEYQNYFGLNGTTEPQPTNGDSHMKYEAVSQKNMALRPFHNAANVPIEYVPAGSKFHGDELWVAPEDIKDGVTFLNRKGDRWLIVRDVDGKDRTGFVAIVHMGAEYCKLTQGEPEPVPPAGEIVFPDYIVAHFSDGVEKRYVPE